MSRGGLRPLRSRSRTTASVIASMSFMSTAPRPQTQPSAISPEKGWWVQSVGVGRHDVGVAVDQQRGPRRVLALDPGHRGGAALVRLEDLRLQTRPRRASPRRTRPPCAPRARVVAVVAGVDPDQLAAEVDDLVLAGDAPGRVRLAHAASSRCRCWWFPLILPPPRRRPKTGPGPSHAVHAAHRGGDRGPRKAWYCFPRRRGGSPARQTPCPGGGMADALA